MRLTTDVLLRMRMLSVPLSESMISEVLSMCLSLGTSIRAFSGSKYLFCCHSCLLVYY